MNELMLYVEKIVRPVRATERRKLRMRRELLAHLQASLSEESARGLDESAALEAAKKRLGEPAALTRSLQKSVPWIERTLLARVPAPRWMVWGEQQIGKKAGMTGKTLGQNSLISFGAMVLTIGTLMILAMRFHGKYGERQMHAISEQTWQFQLGNVIAGAILVILMILCYGILDAVIRSKGWTAIGWRGACAIATILAWLGVITTMVAGSPVEWPEMAMAAGAGIFLVGGLIGLGRLVARMGRGYQEWLTLSIPE